MATTDLELPSGAIINHRYRIQRVLGRGGFGRTYLAADQRRAGELCVLKELVPKAQGDSVVTQKLRELFVREAAILRKLEHPQIPRFFASFEQGGKLFIAQEYVDGKTYWQVLQERMKYGHAFTEVEIVQWLRDLLRVLHYIHQQKIVHRDISPDNIMLPKGRNLPVLIDFGVVKQAVTYFHGIWATNSKGMIQASISVGKFGYAPNEQIRMGQCSPCSDLYALAVTAVVLLTGKTPNLLIDPRSLDWRWQLYAKVDSRLAAILDKMMAEKPQDRYSSAQEVLHELETLGCLTNSLRAERLVPMVDSPSLSSIEQPTHDVTDFLVSPTHVEPAPETNLMPMQAQVQTTSNSSRLGATSEPPVELSSGRLLTNGQSLQPKVRIWMQPKLTKQPLWQVLSLCSIALLPVGGAVVGVRSPYIAPLCQALDNCVQDQRFEQRYHQAKQLAADATQQAETAQSLLELQRARDRMADAIAQLNSISGNSKLAQQVQGELTVYQTHLQSWDERLEKETLAVDLLSRAETAARTALEQAKLAKTPEDYEAVRQQWRKAIETLQAIPGTTLVSDEVNTRLQDYRSRLAEVDLQVAGKVSNGAPNSATQITPQVEIRRRLVPADSQAQATATTGAPSPAQRATSSSASTQRPGSPVASRPTTPAYIQSDWAPIRPSRAAASSEPSPTQASTPVAVLPSPYSALSAVQTLDDVSIRLEGARVSSNGAWVANLVIENHSNRTFGFVPVFAEVRDANYNPVRSRILFGSDDAMVQPGGILQGQLFVFDRSWNPDGNQDLEVVISEGTTGSRQFRIRL